ncbi:MAG: type II toxin-antitoxin system VapC family toxin [Candidatus Binatia bacterium]
MRLVVDASIAVEFLLRTPLGVALQPRLVRSDLLAPDILDAEVLAVLRRATLQRRLDPKRAEEAIDDLAAWPLRRVSSVSLLRGASEFRDNVTAYDALYLAVASRFDAPLLTADGPLARSPAAGIVIENVRRG